MEDRIKQTLAEALGVDLSGSEAEASGETIRRMASLGYVGISHTGTFEFERNRKDAKDTLHHYRDFEEAVRLYDRGQKAEALKLWEAVYAACPDLIALKQIIPQVRRELGLPVD